MESLGESSNCFKISICTEIFWLVPQWFRLSSFWAGDGSCKWVRTSCRNYSCPGVARARMVIGATRTFPSGLCRLCCHELLLGWCLSHDVLFSTCLLNVKPCWLSEHWLEDHKWYFEIKSTFDTWPRSHMFKVNDHLVSNRPGGL